MRQHFFIIAISLGIVGCTQETQNQLGRGIQNWTGTDGVLELYAGPNLVRRFLQIDKLSTAIGTTDDGARDYRYGYGVFDENLNGVADDTETKVYFEIGSQTTYVFYEDPR